ncbi:hypothetical protein FRZ67_22620 [Panacibacter ginsenosidivorans]|uniref:Coproporphyrinogen III oxidase n=1 Tax=Panacibacter ginsenosidivorans TaxID=1813871 RepID=A0A5B8VG21_9BACT|nr:hypothetical protein [Panacibacter ginsenosidivorans]QEC69952.1 hypothetical protein FRZ67_22620 [Panacibacter ginsenosidivorans]
MKNRILFTIALCFGLTSFFAACGSGESKDDMNDTVIQENVSPAPMDTTNSMTDTSMIDTTKKMP